MMKPKLQPCTWLKDEKFFYVDYDFVNPHLVLYSDALRGNVLDDPHGEASRLEKPPKFKEPKKWASIMHQTAGYACHSYYIHARFLEPKRVLQELFKELLVKYNDSCVCRIPNLKSANEYETILNKYKLTANNSYQYLEEGFYPIDIECLKTVTNEKLPKNLQELVVEPKKKEKLWSIFNYVDFKLAILGPNCD